VASPPVQNASIPHSARSASMAPVAARVSDHSRENLSPLEAERALPITSRREPFSTGSGAATGSL
jgi:hypothetical protein